MSYKILVWLLIVAIVVSSCSSISFIEESGRNFEVFNELGSLHPSEIKFLNDNIIKTEFVFAKNDSIYYLSEKDTLAISINGVESVTIKQRAGAIGFGVVAGLGAFIVAGIGTGAVVGGGLGASMLGAVIGIVAGVATMITTINYSGKTEYLFNDKLEYQQQQYYKDKIREKD